MTIQVRDSALYLGRKCSVVQELPLCKHERLVDRPSAQARESLSCCFSTACWRGFAADWELRGDRFYLVGVLGIHALLGDAPLLADWVTGKVILEECESIEDFWADDYNAGLPWRFCLTLEQGRLQAAQRLDWQGNAA